MDSDPLEMENLGSRPDYRTRMEQLMAETWSAIRESGDRTLLETHCAPLRLGVLGPEAVGIAVTEGKAL